MTVSEIDSETLPRLKPRGPVLHREELEVWNETSDLLARARSWTKASKTRARKAYLAEKTRGFNEGLARGKEEAATLIAQTMANASTYLTHLEDELPALICRITEQVLGTCDVSEVITRSAKKEIDGLRQESRAVLRVAPALAEEVHKRLAALCDCETLALVDVKADPTVTDDQCTLVSDFGVVDLSIQAQLASLKAGLSKSNGSECKS